ncbi:flp pilus-assembly TadE/G-like family protein [Mycolicibacterium vaccae]|nr:flp pilus-assembly TadE/G-like family protein [Mycolicibacterium vaccae]
MAAALAASVAIDAAKANAKDCIAQAAADLAALSAAYRIAAGHAAACGTADYVATAMGARVADCAVDGLDVQVRTTVAVPTVGPATGPASAVARAGPVDPAP